MTPDGASADGAAPDASGPEVPFEDRSFGELELLDLGRHPQVAIGADGDVMTVWEWAPFDAEPRCYARRRAFQSSTWDPEHDFVTPEAVSGGLARPAGSTVETVQDYCITDNGLRADASGRAVAAFIHHRTIRYQTAVDVWWSGMRAVFDADSGWSEPEWTGQNAPCCATYGLGMNAQGTAALGWGDEDQLWATAYQPDGGWQGPLLVEEGPIILLEMVLDARGDGLALYEVCNGFPCRLTGVRLKGGAWEAPEPLNDEQSSSNPIDVAMNGDGVALLVWRRCITGPQCEVRARRFDPVSGWEAPVTIAPIGSTGDESNQHMRVAIDAEGNGLAVWLDSWPDPEGAQHPDTGEVLRFATINVARFRDGAWMAPETIHAGELGDGASNPRVALDSAGNGLVAFRWSIYWYQDASWDPHSEFAAQTYTPDGGFAARQTLELLTPSTSLTTLELAMNPSGVGVAVWGRNDQGRARMFR